MKEKSGKKTAVLPGLLPLLAAAVLLGTAVLPCGVLAADSIYGTTGKSTVFFVTAENSRAYITLESYKGTARVQNYALGGTTYLGDVTEEHYGFYTVTVSSDRYRDTCRWVPDARLQYVARGDEIGTTLKISFPEAGTYSVTVTPMSGAEISACWYADRFGSWIGDAAWTLENAYRCSCSYDDPTKEPTGTVLIYCYDENGALIKSEYRTIEGSQTVYPPAIDGYQTVSSGQYVTVFSDGSVSPSLAVFNYRRVLSGGIPQFPTGGYALYLKNPNVDRIRPQCGPGYNYSVFASKNGSTRLYDPRSITFLSAHFCVGDWVYLEFGYTDGVQRYGFFEKQLFDPAGGWNGVPEYPLDVEKHGTVITETTPYNGPGTNCGSYPSCRLYAGDSVHACMEYNGWYLCRFNNNHSNNYGEVYLWVPGSSIRW